MAGGDAAAWETAAPSMSRKRLAEIMAALATPAKTLAAYVTGKPPEGYRWMTPEENQKWMEDSALGFAGTVGPGGAIKGIRAYHGSPYDFAPEPGFPLGRFRMDKIGTGEGAQAYGHGIYMAEAEPVARGYRVALAHKAPIPEGIPQMSDEARAILLRVAGEKDAGKIAQWQSRELRGFDRAQIEEWANKIADAKRGRMYEVNIRANPKDFLNYDTPLGAQGAVTQKLREYGVPDYVLKSPDPAGGFLRRAEQNPYNASDLFNKGGAPIETSPALVSQRLREAGIPGIRYLDQGSRGLGEGTSNYVLFRDDIIDILRKYGIFGLPAMSDKPESRLKKAMTK